jgi:hypothetical protein
MPKTHETPEQKRDRLRADVLKVLTILTSARHDGARVFASKLADIRTDLARFHGWKASDFKDRWGSDDFGRAIDKALQHHRKAGRIEYDPAEGWELARS